MSQPAPPDPLMPVWGRRLPPFLIADEPPDGMPQPTTRPWLSLGAAALAGVGFVVAAELLALGDAGHEILLALGGALLIAAILGATVDRWLKRRLLQDAFSATFGHLLPGELRDELRWIYGQDRLCDRFDYTLTLRATDTPELLVVRFESRRDYRNVSHEQVQHEPRVEVDEWFHEGRPSRVLGLQCIKDDEEIGVPEPYKPDAFSIGKRLPAVQLAPHERVTVVSAAEETRHISDAMFLNLSVATVNPTVTVDAPDDVSWKVFFGNRGQEHVRELGPKKRELPGTLLPGQVIQVRWWPADAVEAGDGT